MRALVSLLGLLLAAPAQADLHGEVSVDLGLLVNGDEAWDLFSYSDVMGSPGARAGLALNDRVTFVLGWQHFRRGQTVFTAGDGDFRAAFTGNALTLGPKVSTPLARWLHPYVTAQAVAFLGVMRLDDDPFTRHNPGQLLETSLTPGVLGMGGLDFRVPFTDELAGAIHLEAGYEWLARGNYGEFGTMRPGGFALRSGVGLRF